MRGSRQGSILFIPGWNGSGPEHWQTLWAREFGAYTLNQKDWGNPQLACWLESLHTAISALPAPITLVAHSLGCVLTAYWANHCDGGHKIGAALLVAPPCLTPPCLLPQELLDFSPVPRSRLPFDAWLVASENDPYLPFDGARDLANAWGASLVNAGRAGHINTASGHGEWPEGKAFLSRLLGRNYGSLPEVVEPPTRGKSRHSEALNFSQR